MSRKLLIVLLLVVVFAAFLRFYQLSSMPPSLNWDEVSHGYNAYSILKTGMDQWGVKFPLFNFRAYGDYPTTLNLYLTIPFIMIFGLTEFGIRFPHALLGTLSVVSVFFLVLGVTKKKNLALLSAFLAATGPWYVFTSRFVLQANLSVFLLVTAAALFVYRRKNRYFLALSLVVFLLTLFAYHSTRIFSPVFLIFSLFIFRREIKSKIIYIFAALFLILSTYILLQPSASARANTLFILDQSAINRIDQERNLTSLPSIVSRFIYNRPVYLVTSLAKNYVGYFSPSFLFLNGGTQYQFSLPGFGLIFPVNIVLFYLGLIILIKKSFNDLNYLWLLGWLAIAPIPASLTNESFAVVRAMTMLPIPEILISFGLVWVLERIPKKGRALAVGLFTFVIGISLFGYLSSYFGSYSKNYSWSWQYGYKEASSYISGHYGEYDKIIVTKKYGEPHEFLLFYLKYNPQKYINDNNKIAFYQSNWWWVDRFDKFYFVNDWQVSEMKLESGSKIDCGGQKCLLLTSPGNFPDKWRKVGTIDFLDGTPAFEIYRND